MTCYLYEYFLSKSSVKLVVEYVCLLVVHQQRPGAPQDKKILGQNFEKKLAYRLIKSFLFAKLIPQNMEVITDR